MQILSRTHSESDCSETIVCRCLQVSQSTVSDAIAICGLASVKEICRETGAGGGCTACHARLRDMLRRTRETVPAG
jgi:NAD(P)H-nitrite reductase large subunit